MPVPLRMRGATNPGGIGHAWVKQRFIEEKAPDRRFIPARIEDNPHADLEEYEKSLAKLPPLERARLRDGDWDAIASEHFKLDWLQRYTWRGEYIVLPTGQQCLLKDLQRFGTADIAASTKTHADHTVISAWAITPRHELVWLDCVRGKWEVPDIVPQMEKVYDRWKLQYLGIEGGGTQQGVYQTARRTRMAVKELHPAGLDKLVRATPAIILAESGRLFLPRSAVWLDAALAEVLAFTGDPRRDAADDIVDTLSYAAQIVTGKADQANQGFAPQVHGGAGWRQ
jgi:predicted phage terminase large subunit-like protein